MTTTQVQTTVPPSRTAVSRGAAWVAALALLANGVNALTGDPATMADHTQGAGAVSEVTAGVAFLAGALALALLTPVTGWRRLLWSLAPFGLGLGGATMVVVPVVDREPAGWLFVLAVVPAFVGTVAAGVLGARHRVWPWWTGAALALLLPIMFLLPFNGLLMTAVWVCVAATTRRPADAEAATELTGTGRGRTRRSG